MNLDIDIWNENENGLPDAAFTEDELTSGVQHIVRTGNPNATSSQSGKPYDDVHIDNKITDNSNAPAHFKTFAQALAWSKENPGKSFTRAANGIGFEAKHSRSVSDSRDRYSKPSEIKILSPELNKVLTKSGSLRGGAVIEPLDRRKWDAELSRLSVAQLSRLRSLLVLELEKNRSYLRDVYAQMQRSPKMRSVNYGQDLFEELQVVIKGAIMDIEKRTAR